MKRMSWTVHPLLYNRLNDRRSIYFFVVNYACVILKLLFQSISELLSVSYETIQMLEEIDRKSVV